MPWFKVDDKLHDHRKTRQAGRSAMGVWVLAGSWAADNLTDGFVPASLLSRWGTTADARKLVSVGLWHEDEQDGEKGWRFHEWLERQPSRTQKLAERKARAEAGRLGGQASGRTRREANPKQSASSVLEPPSRPVPTRPAAAAAAAGGAKRGGGGGGVVDLPGPVAVLRSRMSQHTALAGLRWDTLDADQLERIGALIDRHGDHVLVEWATRTCRTPPPVFASAFLGTWEAIGAPRAVGFDVLAERCDICNQSKRACERASESVPASDRHEFTTTRSA